jgi:methionine synthase II (cobalamin-independent)
MMRQIAGSFAEYEKVRLVSKLKVARERRRAAVGKCEAIQCRAWSGRFAACGRQVKMTVPSPFTMGQQAQNDFYPSLAEAAMDYAVAVNDEIRDLFAAGADIVQVDEPYMQARPQKAEDYGLTALNRALDGVTGTTAVHICFGYAAIIHERPNGHSFLTQLKNCSCRQVSIETARPSSTRLLGALRARRQESPARRHRLV